MLQWHVIEWTLMWKVEYKPCNILHFSGNLHAVKGTILYRRTESLFSRRPLPLLCSDVSCKNLTPWGFLRSSHAFRGGECGSSGTKDMLMISQIEEIGMATSKSSV